ncbi:MULTISPECIES: acetyl-CoA acetyltransferase [unclassified Novosphingobium]|uniref:acetyl-CoA acetyltransferase n=1 Tax=unclassified Novosphingobium TaxID=2644732 RepID=UPI0025EFB67F|nr:MULTISPECIES: acetyl-CoA acetyltransferase [unclassified Novosphingobium]HQV03829.1 acetyl-CoA acetyltransferase [Novosphingobium sp.]
MDPNTPVIIGVGQHSERVGEEGYRELSHMDLGGEALKAAFADARAKRKLGPALDTIAAIRQFEISATRYSAPFGHSNNTPRSIARRAGANPERAILEVVGGQGPQRLVGELAAEIAAGRSRMAAVVGAEAISTMRALLARGEKRDWSERRRGSLEDRGPGYEGVVDRTAIKHGVGAPIAGYAIAENVRRERLGLSLADYRLEIGKLFAPFTRVAAANPHSAAPTERTAEELATLTERNRLVAEPYGRLVVARDQVNQGGAVVLASVAEARRLGVPEERWVHIHGVADCAEPAMFSRASLEQSPAAVAAISTALELSGKSWENISAVDLYSCFAIPVFNLLDAFGLDRDDSRGWTLTGGLPFFGGAGNNYSAHGIAEAVQRCRAAPGSFALVGANGGIMSKYAAGVYSTAPADWQESRWQSLDKIKPAFDVLDAHDGEAVAESFTIQPGKTGEVATIAARLQNARVLANSTDPAICAELRSGKVAGRAVRIEEGEGGVNRFWFI